MSPRLVATFAVAAIGSASMLAIWLATREGPSTQQPPPTVLSEQRISRSQGSQAALGVPHNQAPPPSATPAVTSPHDAELLVKPLFEASMRLEAQHLAALRFRAQRVGSGEPAMHVDLSVFAVQAAGRPQLPLPVRELGSGVYEAAFVPPEPGEYMALVTARGQATRSVHLSVVGTPDEAGDRGPSSSNSARPGHSGVRNGTTRRGH